MKLARSTLLTASLLAVASASAQWTGPHIPAVWIDPLVPEQLPALEYPAYFNDLDKAELQAFRGRHKLALMTLAKLSADADVTRVARVRAESLFAIGRFDDALAAASDKKAVDDARVTQTRARILQSLGRFDDAVGDLQKLVARDAKSPSARYALAQALRARGDTAAERKELDWFADPAQKFLEMLKTGDTFNDSAEELVAVAAALDRWAVLNGKYAENRPLHNLLAESFVRAFDVVDRNYWPARVRSAEYFVAHDNFDAATEDLKAALDANPRAPDALELMARIGLEKHEFARAAGVVDTFRGVDRDSPEADAIEARSFLLQRRYAEAETGIRRVLARRPRDLSALSLLAAAQTLLLNDDGAKQTIAAIEAIDPDNDEVYTEIGSRLADVWQYDRAAKLLHTAVDRAGYSVEARNALGLAQLSNGEEDAARAVLDAAHTIDPFNLKTTNFLRVLDDLQTFKGIETAHFSFKFAAVDDPFVPLLIAPRLEDQYAAFTKQYGFEPKRKTLVEIFPDANSFSVRTAGELGLHTFGASVGPIITAIAPRTGTNGKTMGRYHWSRVIGHEFVHVLNMAQTESRCPRWLTEGLAVASENVEFRFPFMPQAMYDAATGDKLFSIRELNDFFASVGGTRKAPGPYAGEVAYMEGFWFTQYLTEIAGPDAIVRLLDAYKQAKNDDAAVSIVTGRAMSDVEENFHAWAKQRVEKWGYDKETAGKYKLAAERGETAIKNKQIDVAISAFTEASSLQPKNVVPHRRLAALMLLKKDLLAAAIHLEAVVPLELQDQRYAKRLARLYRDIGNLPAAMKYATEAIRVDLYDADAHQLLLELATKSADDATVAREKTILAAIATAKTAASEPATLPAN